MQKYLSTSCKPLGLLVEEPEVGSPEEAVEEAEEHGDVGLGELGAGAAALNLHVAYLSVTQVQTLFTSSFWQSIAATDSPEQTLFRPIGRKINYSSWWMTRYRYHSIR